MMISGHNFIEAAGTVHYNGYLFFGQYAFGTATIIPDRELMTGDCYEVQPVFVQPPKPSDVHWLFRHWGGVYGWCWCKYVMTYIYCLLYWPTLEYPAAVGIIGKAAPQRRGITGAGRHLNIVLNNSRS